MGSDLNSLSETTICPGQDMTEVGELVNRSVATRADRIFQGRFLGVKFCSLPRVEAGQSERSSPPALFLTPKFAGLE